MVKISQKNTKFCKNVQIASNDSTKTDIYILRFQILPLFNYYNENRKIKTIYQSIYLYR